MKTSRATIVLAVLFLCACSRQSGIRRGTLSSDAGEDAAGGAAESSATIEVGGSGRLDGAEDYADDSGNVGVSGQCGSQIGFEITLADGVDAGTLCETGCDGMSVAMASGDTQLAIGRLLSTAVQAVWVTTQPVSGCVVLCDTCHPADCPMCVRCSPFSGGGGIHIWDGSYFPNGGTCNGVSCMGPPRCAPLGHYTATFCVSRCEASVSGNLCMPREDMACSTVEFDLPSTTTLNVELGP